MEIKSISCAQTIIQTKAKLDKYYGNSAPSISIIKKMVDKNGLLDLVVAVQARTMPNILDA